MVAPATFQRREPSSSFLMEAEKDATPQLPTRRISAASLSLSSHHSSRFLDTDDEALVGHARVSAIKPHRAVKHVHFSDVDEFGYDDEESLEITIHEIPALPEDVERSELWWTKQDHKRFRNYYNHLVQRCLQKRQQRQRRHQE